MWEIRYEKMQSHELTQALLLGWEPFAVGPADKVKGYIYEPDHAIIWMRKEVTCEAKSADSPVAVVESKATDKQDGKENTGGSGDKRSAHKAKRPAKTGHMTTGN